MQKQLSIVAAVCTFAAANASANIFITEWMYSGSGGEFIELTNYGPVAIDLTGWSYDDDSQTPGVFDLSGFGVVGAGESVILCEDTAANFRANWGLDASVKVLGEYTNNLGRNDEINIFDSNNDLVDRLTYGDEDFPGSIRTQNVSGVVKPTFEGLNNVFGWNFSDFGDVHGAALSAVGDLGSPGFHYIPTPGAAALGFLALGCLTRRKR